MEEEMDLPEPAMEEEVDLPEPGPMDDGTYTVEKIVSKRINEDTGLLEYEIKWVGWSTEDNTFEKIDNLVGSEVKIKEFEDRKYREEQKKKRNRYRARHRSVSASAASDADDEGTAGPSSQEENEEEEDDGTDESPQRKAAIDKQIQDLITSQERKIVAVRAIELGCNMLGTRDVFDVLFDNKRCVRIPDYKLDLLSKTNYRFIENYYIRRIDEIAAAKEKAYKANLKLAYELLPPEERENMVMAED